MSKKFRKQEVTPFDIRSRADGTFAVWAFITDPTLGDYEPLDKNYKRWVQVYVANDEKSATGWANLNYSVAI